MPLDKIGLKTRFEVDGEKKVERALDDINKKVDSTQKHFENLAQTLADMGRPYAQIVRITGAAAAATVKYAVDTKRADEALRQMNATTERSAQELAKEEAALRRSAAARERSVKKLALFAIGTRTAFSLMMKLRRVITESIDDVFGATREWSRYKEGMDALRLSIVATAGELIGLPDIVGAVGDKARFVAEEIAAMRVGFMEMIADLKRGDFTARFALFDPAEKPRLRAEGAEIVAELLANTAEETKKFQSALNSLFEATTRFDKELERNAESLAKVNEQFTQAEAAATGKLFARLNQIQVNFQRDAAKIDANALKDRTRAFANFERQITELQQREVDNRERLRQQNQLEREFASRRFQLNQIQNERMFQSERGFLVAEGDVLAIERLDERHRIEQETQGENFRLQEQQTEAMFRLQLRFQEQAMRQQIAALGDALRLQLAAIEENRQERIAAQKERAAEERMEAKQAFGAQIADALASQIEQTNNLKTQLAEREKAMAESLAALIRSNNLAAPKVMEAWEAIYGPNKAFDTLITQAIARANRRMLQFANILSGIGGGGRLPFLPVTMRAHGGDDVVTRPTLFMAGEAGPERIITQPLGSIGGNISVSWRGGAIPVQGQGLEGADVSGMGDSIVEGLMIRLSAGIQNARGVR